MLTMHTPRLRFLSSTISRPAHAKYLRASRRLHTPLPLPYSVEGGLGSFLPPAALKTLAVDYQTGLLERLNEEVRGSPEENKSVAQTVVSTARSRQKVLAFNYASLALNNSFFLDRLRPPPAAPKKNHQGSMDEGLYTAIVDEYGSIASFKSAFSAAVSGIFSNGYVWFVTDKSGNIGIYPTFGPGSLLVGSRSYPASRLLPTANKHLSSWYREELDREYKEDEEENEEREFPATHSLTARTPPGVTPSSPTSGVSGTNVSKFNPLHSRSYNNTGARQSKGDLDFQATSIHEENSHDLDGYREVEDNDDSLYQFPELDDDNDLSEKQEEKLDLPEGGLLPSEVTDFLQSGETLFPLFCVPVYEHAWMSAGYGIFGKEEWMKHFWSVLDWEKVSSEYLDSVVEVPEQ
ncbi:hypothetical protein BDQ17DRAFT_1539258 [Cyathus striatus]|nr:hypothetical protein BDQ17DRAFT_1539258 [Cyathus striatus]